MESLTLPASLKTIQGSSISYTYNSQLYYYMYSEAFMNCPNLKVLDMSACENLTEIPARFISNAVSLETLLLPPNLVKLHSWAFGNASDRIVSLKAPAMISLKEIIIPASVTDIGCEVFYGCESLEKVTFESGSALTRLGVEAAPDSDPFWGLNIFANTPALNTVVLPDNLALIGIGCFENSGVANIQLPASVKSICEAAFRNCDNLKEVALSAELALLGNEAF